MKLLVLFLFAFAVQRNSATEDVVLEKNDSEENRWLTTSSHIIDSREHGVTAGRRSTSCSCGVANRAPGSRIVGGRVYGKNEYPFIAGLVQLTPTYRPFCGGTIISQYHVVTAAHCTNDIIGKAPLHVVLGDHDRSMGRRPDDVIIQVASIAQHQQFDPRSLMNDISVLILSSPIQFNSKVSPICMPLGPMNLVGQHVRVIGWGAMQNRGAMTTRPQKVDLRVIDSYTCSASWNGMVHPNSPHICTHSNRKTACQGDSGGPVIYLNPETNRYTLVGAVSFGENCQDTKPSVQTDVTRFLSWINSVIAATKPARTCA